VDIKRSVNYAIETIYRLQTELDIKSSSIDKAAIGNFLPSLNANASHSWNIGLNQDITTVFVNKTTQFTSAGAVLELIFIKVYRIKTH
jgi:outer membrane protein